MDVYPRLAFARIVTMLYHGTGLLCCVINQSEKYPMKTILSTQDLFHELFRSSLLIKYDIQ